MAARCVAARASMAARLVAEREARASIKTATASSADFVPGAIRLSALAADSPSRDRVPVLAGEVSRKARMIAGMAGSAAGPNSARASIADPRREGSPDRTTSVSAAMTSPADFVRCESAQ